MAFFYYMMQDAYITKQIQDTSLEIFKGQIKVNYQVEKSHEIKTGMPYSSQDHYRIKFCE